MSTPFTPAQLAQLLENGRRRAAVSGAADEIDLRPVVKLFMSDGAATWLLTALDTDADTAFGSVRP
jgi:Protein of unknown function (DUF2958)